MALARWKIELCSSGSLGWHESASHTWQWEIREGELQWPLGCSFCTGRLYSQLIIQLQHHRNTWSRCVCVSETVKNKISFWKQLQQRWWQGAVESATAKSQHRRQAPEDKPHLQTFVKWSLFSQGPFPRCGLTRPWPHRSTCENCSVRLAFRAAAVEMVATVLFFFFVITLTGRARCIEFWILFSITLFLMRFTEARVRLGFHCSLCTKLVAMKRHGTLY